MPALPSKTLTALVLALLLVLGATVVTMRLGPGGHQEAADHDALGGPRPAPALSMHRIESIDPATLSIALQVDRTRAPLADVAEQFRARLAAAPDDHVSLTVLGATLLAHAREEADLDLYAEAEVVAERALALAPESPDARLVKAGAVAARHDFATARAVAADIVAESPGHPEALTALADADLAIGDVATAKTAFTALAAGDRNPGILSRLSRIAFLEGETQHAVDLAIESLVAAQSLPLRPSEASFYWFQLGFVLFEGGDVDGAAGSLERALEITPTHPGANELLARVRTSQGRTDEAMAIYRSLLESGPAADLHGELAILLDLAGRPDEAATQVEAGLELAALTVDRYPAERRHLVSFLVDHDPTVALRLAEEDFAERKDVYAYDTLAWARYATGDFDGAGTLIDSALATGLVDADVFFHAGMIRRALGDHAAATMYLGTALDLNPEFDPVDAALARAAIADSTSMSTS